MLKPFFAKGVIEAGTDEAGRGCLAGPVFAAAVILPKRYNIPLLNDSKVLSEKEKHACKQLIIEQALAYSIASISHSEIDEINILQASIKAMHLALEGLRFVPEHIIVDGNRFKPFGFVPYTCVVKGDSKYASIAAASILAKTARDEFMCNLHSQHPQYGWLTNMGYPTLAHRKAIGQYGLSPWHRRTFRCV